MELTKTQLDAIDSGRVVHVTIDGRSCVVISSAAFEKSVALALEWHPSTMVRPMADIMADDWTDPAMNIYDG